jgi:hypothetical protein
MPVKLEEVTNREFDTPYGHVRVYAEGDRYRIVIIIDKRKIGENIAKQIAAGLLSSLQIQTTGEKVA